MKYYNMYMDRQEISPEVHDKLLRLERPRRRSAWVRYGALAACAAIIIGVGVWRLAPDQAPASNLNSAAQFAPGYEPQPGEQDTVGPEDPAPQGAVKGKTERESPNRGTEDSVSRAYPGDSFVVNSPAEEGKQMFPMIPGIDYRDVTGDPSPSADWCWAKGTFKVFLNKEDIQTIFWGPEGKPEADHPKNEQGDLPWMLFWDGYTVRSHAWYSPEGRLLEVYLTGEKDNASFELRMDPGQLPITCLYHPDVETSDVLGTEVTGWRRVYDWDGDDRDDYICGSEFMTKDNIGVRFENYGSSLRGEYAENGDMDLGGACMFNALFVRQALVNDGGLYLDHLLTAEVPDDPDGTW